MNTIEKQIIYSAVLRLANNEEELTPAERRDVINELCRGLCDMSLDEILNKTENQRKLRIKRGGTNDNDEYVGLAGEITMDTDAKTIRIHDGETTGGVAMARAMDIAGDWVVESQLPSAENNYTWYRKYKSGWVEQGGRSASQTVTLPIEMADVNYLIQLTGSCNTGNNNVIVHGFRDVTTTGFVTQGNVLNNKGESAASNTSAKYWCVYGISA